MNYAFAITRAKDATFSRASRRINRSTKEKRKYRLQHKGERRIGVDTGRSKLNRGFHGIRHQFDTQRKRECVSSKRKREREKS